MAWWSDWGSDAAYEDIDDANDQLEAWMQNAVDGGWPQGAATAMIELGNDTLQDNETWFGIDTGTAEAYWSAVRSGAEDAVEDAGYDPDELANWDEWMSALDSAAGTAETTEAAREEGSIATVVSGTVAGTGADFGAILETAMWWGIYGAAAGAVVNPFIQRGTGPYADKFKRYKTGAIVGWSLEGARNYGLTAAAIGAFLGWREASAARE
tara:strand:- start:511 stop:1143 length:633 start_codon:yes stop_codon:yes gene_type:complete